eukprot:g3216.t1
MGKTTRTTTTGNKKEGEKNDPSSSTITTAVALAEFNLHAAPVIELYVSPDGKYLFSAAKDGTIFCCALCEYEGDEICPWEKPSRAFFNAPTVVLLRKDLEEMNEKIVQLGNKIEDIRSEAKLELDLLTRSSKNQLNAAESAHKSQLEEIRGELADARGTFDRTVEKHADSMRGTKEAHRETTREMEASYDYKLSNEMARYDKLKDDMDYLKIHCEGALRQQEELLRDEIDVLKEAHRKRRQLFEEEIVQLREDMDESAKKSEEERRQQESEYEKEIQSLKLLNKQAVEKEWKEQAKKEAEIMEQKSKMKKKSKQIVSLEEANAAELARAKSLSRKNQELQRLLEHRHHSIQEMKASLRDKEKEILTLRANNRKLNHFRFVLDDKVQDLMRERAPAAEHIAKLEERIEGMEEELVKDFSDKKAQSRQMSKKDLKIESLAKEVRGLRVGVRDREQTITAFTNMLDRSVKTTNPKEAMESLKSMYRTFVKKDDRTRQRTGSDQQHRPLDEYDDVDASTLNEALRQRSHMEKTCATLKRALKIAEQKLRSQTKRSMAQNALLINECNALRKENKMTKILMHEVEENNKLLKRRQGSGGGGGSVGGGRGARSAESLTPFLARKKKEQRASAAKSSSSVTTLPGISRDGGGNMKKSPSSRVTALTRRLEERAKASEAQEREIRRLRSQIDALLEAAPNGN